MNLKRFIKQQPLIKQLVHRLLIPSREARPRRWVRWFVNPFVHRHHPTARIRSRVRLDVLPFNTFRLGKHSLIEDYCVVNNGVGAVEIGSNCLLGIGSTLIGPVRLGNNVITAQHVVMSGLNHDYEAILTPIRHQPVTIKPIVIDDDCWIGANATILAGVTIGQHSVVAAGSVVTRHVPPYSVVGGNPARVLKQYDPALKQWINLSKSDQVANSELQLLATPN
ncbi:DapH/DapD/GlmU-related protein [Fibrella sp. WM1]|uniref:acyltransferase n=1 Tax=Fibrella musci TaxID=3242485 RepID=UPI0035203E7F